jgi:cytochrome P450
VEELREDFFTFIIAGNDTTSSTVTSCLYFLKKFPGYEKPLRDEIRKKFGNDPKLFKNLKGVLTSQAISELDLVNNFVKETLRLENVSGNTVLYRVNEKVNIRGVELYEGIQIMVGIAAVHMNPKIW